MSFRDTIRAYARSRHKTSINAGVSQALRCEPSKDDLRAMLAEAARNTSNLPAPTDGDHHASDHRHHS